MKLHDESNEWILTFFGGGFKMDVSVETRCCVGFNVDVSVEAQHPMRSSSNAEARCAPQFPQNVVLPFLYIL